MADISKIKVPDSQGTPVEYTLKDLYARNKLASLTANIIRFIGYTTTTIIDGSEISSIDIVGQKDEHKAVSGDVVIYDPNGATTLDEQEFIWDGQAWREFGSKAALKELAFKDEATGILKVLEPTGTVTNEATYDKTTKVTITDVPTDVSIKTNGSTISVPVTGSSTTSFTYNAPKKGTDTTTIIKATASGAAITPTGPVTVANTIKTATSGKAITGLTTEGPTYTKYLTKKAIYQIVDNTTASELVSAGEVTTEGTDVSYTAGTIPSLSATKDENDCLVFSFNAGSKSTVSGGVATVVTMPTFKSVSVPVASTTTTNVWDGVISDTSTEGAQKILVGVGVSGTVDCITSVGIDKQITAYTGFSVTNPTISLDKSQDTSAKVGEVSIATEHWTTEPTAGSIEFNGTAAVPFEVNITKTDVDATLAYTETAAVGTLTADTTSSEKTVKVS